MGLVFNYYIIRLYLCFVFYIFFPSITLVIKFMWPVELTIMLEELATSHTSVGDLLVAFGLLGILVKEIKHYIIRILPFFEMAT